jgi:RNA polymerase sigma-70 factor, ECF subfamily
LEKTVAPDLANVATMSAQAAIPVGRPGGGMDPLVAAAAAGDRSAFSELAARHRRQVQAHAYRLLGSHEDSEDLTQETFLRAWRMRSTFQGRSSFQSWLFRIATNACLSMLERRRGRRAIADGLEVPGAEASPPVELMASADLEPDAELVSKETLELVFLAAFHCLPPKQRAVLIVRDVLGWPAKDTAELLETSLASVNSALQRARAAMRSHLPRHRLEWAAARDPGDENHTLLDRYVDAVARDDTEALVATLRDDTGLTSSASR